MKGVRSAEARGNGSRIADSGVRRLHDVLCEELLLLSPRVAVERAPFETRFALAGRTFARIAPYRELFLVSAGADPVCEVRVVDSHGLLRALDLALESFLVLIQNDPAV